MACQYVPKAAMRQILSNFSTILFDCDGVLWNACGLIPGAVDAVKRLKSLGKQLVFVTNNSTKTRLQYLEKFKSYGFDVRLDEIYGSSYLAAVYVKNILHLPETKKVYLIGGAGLTGEFDSLGLRYVGPGPLLDNLERGLHLQFDLHVDPDVGAVVVGYDEHFNLHKIAQAMQYLLSEDIPFIATNTDARFPVGGGVFTPGTGCIVSAVKTASQREPVIVGKPEKMMFECIQAVHSIEPTSTLMVGDRLDTDILFGKNCGLATLCVLTGVSDIDQLEKEKLSGSSRHIPDFFTDSVASFLFDL